jgi:hypothetical protein
MICFPNSLFVLQRVMLFGSLLRQSSLLRYLPAYFDFVDDSVEKQREQSPKAEKRQKTEDKLTQFAKLLKPQNEADSDDNDSDPELPGRVAQATNVVAPELAEEVKTSSQVEPPSENVLSMDPNLILAGFDCPPPMQA